jgi:hypothetical protein
VHVPLPAEIDAPVDGEMRGVGGEFRGHHDRDGGDHGKKLLHYSDITITIKSASDDHEIRPDQVLMTTELHHPQPATQQQQPTPQPTSTNNTSFQTPAFPKEVKKERSTLRKKLVRIKISQLVHNVDDLEDISFSTTKTMTTIRLSTPITRTATTTEAGGKKVSVGLPEVPPPLLLPSTLSAPVNNITSSISLPISASKKKRSTFKSLFKNFVAKW